MAEAELVRELAQLRVELTGRHVNDHGDHVIRRLVEATSKVDGASAPALRTWFREVDLTIPLTAPNDRAPVEIATRTVSGALRLETERWIQEQAQRQPPVLRNAILWPDLRAHIAENFLTRDEAAHMRRELETIAQTAFETEASFIRRFRDVAASAYPPAARNEDQQRIMLDAFLSGLSNKKIAAEIVLHENAVTAEEAMVLVARYSGAEERLKRLHAIHRESPMEINASANPVAEETAVEKLRKEMAQAVTKIAKLEAQVRGVDAVAVSKNAKTTSKICGYCRRVGHEERECRTKKRTPPPERTSDVTCYKCRKRGHFARECRSAPRRDVAYPQRPAGTHPHTQVHRQSGNERWGPSFA